MARETVESLLEKAQRAIAEGQHAQARAYYQQAIGLRSDNPDAHYGMATVCFLMNDLASSAFHFKEVTRLDPLRAGAYINLGAVYNRLEQYDEAIAVLRRGIQLDLNRAEGYYNLGLVYRRKGLNDMAIQAYREAVRVNPRMADAHYNIANIYYEKDQYALAIAHYKQALEVRPGWEKALRGLEAAQEAAGGAADTAATAASAETAPTRTTSRKLDPERQVDGTIHGDILRNLHRATIDTDQQGRAFLETLEKKVEPAIKELSNCLLYPDTPLSEVTTRVREFEEAVDALRKLQENLKSHVGRVQTIGEQLLQS
ncbi:MAG: tetratricopeptide repeat protein [Gemmataceae bacterium]|nr:tetratricopeptide repeat protein [Gemmataceae bacterium]